MRVTILVLAALSRASALAPLARLRGALSRAAPAPEEPPEPWCPLDECEIPPEFSSVRGRAGAELDGAFKVHCTVFGAERGDAAVARSSGRVAATPRGATWIFRGRPNARKIDGCRRRRGRALWMVSFRGLRGADRGDAAGRDVNIPRARRGYSEGDRTRRGARGNQGEGRRRPRYAGDASSKERCFLKDASQVEKGLREGGVRASLLGAIGVAGRVLAEPSRIWRRDADTKEPGKLILIRHGQSTWNANKTFTGWVDVDLSDVGVTEVEHAARLMLERGLKPDVVYTSVLKRAIRSAWILLQESAAAWRQRRVAATPRLGVRVAAAPRPGLRVVPAP